MLLLLRAAVAYSPSTTSGMRQERAHAAKSSGDVVVRGEGTMAPAPAKMRRPDRSSDRGHTHGGSSNLDSGTHRARPAPLAMEQGPSPGLLGLGYGIFHFFFVFSY